MMLNIFYQSLFNDYVDEFKINLLTQGSILTTQISKDYDNLEKEAVFDYVSKYVKETSLKLDSRILILNKEKKVLIDSHDLLKGFVISNFKEVDIALTGASEANLYNIEDVGETMYVSVPIANKDSNVLGAIFISKNADSIFDSINSTMNKVALISLLGLLITAFVSFVISDVLSTPVEKMTEAVRSITMGDFSKKIKITSTDEMSKLGNAFNLMSTRLYQVDEQRAKFVANVSHELRTPLTSIKIISESLLASEELPIEITKDFLQDVDSEVDRLNKIIDSLLYLVDMEKKELELELKLTYVNYLVRNVIKKLHPLAEKKNIEVHLIEIDEIQVRLDQDKIKQALINILGNAIKFTPENGDIYVQIYFSPNETLTIEIEDTGIGIPEEDIKYIFDRFYRVDESRARHSGGSGLGLSIAQQIINLHQGQVYIQSKIDIGTKFIVILPKNIGV